MRPQRYFLVVLARRNPSLNKVLEWSANLWAKPHRQFKEPLLANLDLADGAALQALSESPGNARPENNDICRNMLIYSNIEGFLTYWCIYDVYPQGSVWGFPMLLYWYWWHKLGWDNFTMLSRGSPRDLALFSGVRPRARWGYPKLIWSLFNSTKAQGTILDLHGPLNGPCKANINRAW